MRVLIVNQYYPPDTSATARVIGDVVHSIASAGHDVTVLCGRPSYDPTKRYGWLPWRVERRDRVRIVRLGSTAFDRRRLPGRACNYLSYLALATVGAFVSRADVIVPMTDPPLSVAAAVIGRRGRRIVYNIRDLHPEFSIAARLVEPGVLSRLWHRLHHWALARVDAVVVLGDDMATRLYRKGIDASRVHVVRDGAFLGPRPDPADRHHPVARELHGPFRFTCVHAGNLGFGGPWETLLEAAALLRSEGVGFVFVGEGWERGHVAAAAPPNVRVVPFRPADEVRYVMAAGDLQVVAVRAGLDGIIVPSKLYGILAAARPVLAVVPAASDVARIVRGSDCGFVCDPSDPRSVADAVHCALSDHQRLAEMGDRARQAAKRFERSECLSRLVDVLESAGPVSVMPPRRARPKEVLRRDAIQMKGGGD